MNLDRRTFLRRASLIAAGVVAADQVELLERLTHQRTLFPSAAIRPAGNWEIQQPWARYEHIPDGGYETVLSTPSPIWVPS